MPDLIRLYVRHVLIGFGLGTAFTTLLLGLNVANLWTLVRATDGGPIAVLMLIVFNSIVFSGVQFAFAVMSMSTDEGPTAGLRAPLADAPVAAGNGGRNRSDRAGVNFPRA